MIRENRTSILEQTHKDLQRVYGHIRHGGKVVQIFSSFKNAGLNEQGNPKLAICRADVKTCYLAKHTDGGAVYSPKEFTRWEARTDGYSGRKSYGDVKLPNNTFTFPRMFRWFRWDDHIRQTSVPIIPVAVLQPIKHTLKNYHIIWEVEEWKKAPRPPRDPILAKLVNNNVALVLATWDLTELERVIIQGRL